MAKKDKLLESIDSLFEEAGISTAALYDLLEDEIKDRPAGMSAQQRMGGAERIAAGGERAERIFEGREQRRRNEPRSRQELVRSRLEERERAAADRVNERKARERAEGKSQTKALALREDKPLTKTAGKTAAKTAAKTMGKRGLLSLLMRGGGALAGGPVGIGLLGLSLLPLLLAGDRMSQADRERAVKEITDNQKAQRLAARRTNRRNPIADSIYERDLDRGFAEATRPQGSISPDLAALLGEEQGRLESLNESLGGSQRISLEQALRGMGS